MRVVKVRILQKLPKLHRMHESVCMCFFLIFLGWAQCWSLQRPLIDNVSVESHRHFWVTLVLLLSLFSHLWEPNLICTFHWFVENCFVIYFASNLENLLLPIYFHLHCSSVDANSQQTQTAISIQYEVFTLQETHALHTLTPISPSSIMRIPSIQITSKRPEKNPTTAPAKANPIVIRDAFGHLN